MFPWFLLPVSKTAIDTQNETFSESVQYLLPDKISSKCIFNHSGFFRSIMQQRPQSKSYLTSAASFEKYSKVKLRTQSWLWVSRPSLQYYLCLGSTFIVTENSLIYFKVPFFFQTQWAASIPSIYEVPRETFFCFDCRFENYT